MNRTLFYLGGLIVLFGIVSVTSYAAVGIQEGDRPEPQVTIFVTPAEIKKGESATLSWNSKFSTSCYGDGAWDGSKSRSGTKTVAPRESATYQLTCRGRGGVTTVSTTLTVISGTPVSQPPVQQPPAATSTPTSTAPVLPPADETGPLPQPAPEPEPPVATTTEPVTTGCPVYEPISCSPGSFVTSGPSTGAGCVGAPRCSVGAVTSTPQPLTLTNAVLAAAQTEYGSTGRAGVNAYSILAPTTGATTTVQVQNLSLASNKVWWLTGTIGLLPVVQTVATTTPTPKPPTRGNLLGATYGGSVLVTVTASATKIDSTDKDSEIIYSSRFTPQAALQSVKIPLGVWGMRPNLKLTIAVQKTAKDTLVYGAMVDGLSVYSFGERPEQGIVNNDPMWKTNTALEKGLAALKNFNVAWIHDSIRTTGSSWPQAPILKREQDQGKKIQLVVGPIDEDFALGEGARLVTTQCPWGFTLPFSKLDLDRYEKRLRANLTAYKAAGVDVKAIEVGNELDLHCFNGDIPLDRKPTDADYQLFAQKYAAFLERTVGVAKLPEFYPNAKIILGSPAIDWSPATGKMEPGLMYAPLKNINGKNYFNLVDGIGIHYYPDRTETGKESIERTKAFLATIGETSRPLWVSEWGFYNSHFPNAAGVDRYRAFVTLYDEILKADFKVVFMTNFALDEFTFPFHLVDQAYNKLPEARFFEQYGNTATAPIAERVLPDPVACTACAYVDWLDELAASIRDWWLTLRGN